VTSRILPYDEYVRLTGTAIECAIAALPRDARVLVVEDGDRLVAHAVLMNIVHVHGVWIDPTRVEKLGVATRLWRLFVRAAREMGATTSVMTDCDSEPLRALLARVGGQAYAYQPYTVPIGVE